MIKQISKLIKVLPLLTLILLANISFAQGSFLLTVQNLTQPTLKTVEFDVKLKNTSIASIELVSIQLGLSFNSLIYTGGTISAAKNNTGTGLNSFNVFTSNPNTGTSGVIKLSGRPVAGCGNGTVILPDAEIQITHFTLTSSVNFTINTNLNLAFLGAGSAYPSLAPQYVYNPNCVNTPVIITPGFNAVVSQSLVLNPSPIAYDVTGSGSYCSGNVGLAVGLANSETGVTYTLYKNTVAQVPTVAGVTGSAITFGNQLAGTYTISGTKNAYASTTTMTGSAIIMENANNWTGAVSTDWNNASNWCGGIPTASTDVIIPNVTNKPIINLGSLAICNNLTIDNLAVLTITSGKALTVNGSITNNAGVTGLVIKSSGSASGSLLHNTASVNATFERYIAGNTWNYISTPFASSIGATTAALIPTGGQAYVRPYTDGSAWGTYISSLTYQFAPMQGYALWLTLPKTLSFTGSLTNGQMIKSLTLGNGWNFTGNPYPSAIDWELVGRTNAGPSMYLWDNVYAVGTGNYRTYNATSHVGVPVSTTKYVSPFQGFFVIATGASASITFNNSARVHNGQSFYKDLSSPAQVIARLKITDSQNRFDELVVCNHPDANNDLDDFDSKKMSAEGDAPEIVTMAQNEQLVINTLQTLPSVVPVNIKTSAAGAFILNAFDLLQDGSTTIKLEDTQLGTMTDLLSNATTTVTLLQGDNSNRFFLHFGSAPNSINEVENSSLLTFVRDNQLFVYFSGTQTISQVSLYDITGRIIATQQCDNTGCTFNTLHLGRGVYIVKANVEKGTVTRKVNIY